jgi:hypothetical protein
VVRNNVFAFSRGGQIMRTKPEAHLSFTFEHNIVYWTAGSLLDGNWSGNGYRFDRNVYFQSGGKPVAFDDASLEAAGAGKTRMRMQTPVRRRRARRLRLKRVALALGFRPHDQRAPRWRRGGR